MKRRGPVYFGPACYLGRGSALAGTPARVTDLPRRQREDLLERYFGFLFEPPPPRRTTPVPGVDYRELGVEPDPDHLVAAPIRAISAVMVQGHWVDHRDPQHLKDALPLFEGRPIFINHISEPHLAVGRILEPEWDDTRLPPDDAPGVNVMAVIDAQRSAEAFAVARGVADRSLNRWSLGFGLEAEPSHPDLSEDDFWMGLGDEVDGETVAWSVTAITDVYEESVVDAGAVASARTLARDDVAALRASHARTAKRRRRYGFPAAARRG